MSRVLVTYASKHGSTEQVARAIGATIRRAGHHVDVRSAKTAADVEWYDAVVVGGSVYMGRWHADARRFLRKHHDELSQRHLAVFAMGPLKLTDDDVAGVRAQLDRALKHTGALPELVAIFGGVVDPDKLHFPFNRMPETDARDWEAIERWAIEIAALVDKEPSLLS